MLFLFKTALQVIVLIERAARKNIGERNKGLDDFMPNRKDCPQSQTRNFSWLSSRTSSKEKWSCRDGKAYGFVSELTELQKDILSVFGSSKPCLLIRISF